MALTKEEQLKLAANITQTTPFFPWRAVNGTDTPEPYAGAVTAGISVCCRGALHTMGVKLTTA
jgi:hypothetical protein